METEKNFGWNAGHYRKHFERMQRAGKIWLAGWNFAAFLHSTGWFWYRRMYGWSVLNLITPVVLLLMVVSVVQWLAPGNDMKLPVAAAGACYLVLVFGLLPLYADSLYLYRLKKDGKVPRPPSILTAIGALLIIVIPALMVYVVAIAQYEYGQRVRIREGVYAADELKKPVAEFYLAQRRLPGAQEAARFQYAKPMKFTASVGWDAGRGAIVVVLGERFDGKRFELAPVGKDGALEWTCRGIDLEQSLLPPNCR
jgi:hypothetical protein